MPTTLRFSIAPPIISICLVWEGGQSVVVKEAEPGSHLQGQALAHLPGVTMVDRS